jgi:hypothetical protein
MLSQVPIGYDANKFSFLDNGQAMKSPFPHLGLRAS